MSIKNKQLSLDEVKNKYIGKLGSLKREQYEMDLSLDLIGSMIKQVRLEKRMTQEELGKLVGVQKAQISKLESGSVNVTISTIVKVFDALKAKIKFNVVLDAI